jgi:magnesium chelatase subunit I
MHAEIRTVRDPELRVQIVEQRSDFDQDPQGYLAQHEATQVALQKKLVAAQNDCPRSPGS